MKTLADSRILFAREAFSQFGEVREFTLPIDLELTRDVDILLTRSDVTIDRRLLALCRPRFIASPTVGTDHVDLEFLKEEGIEFAHAPGCNSDSVRDYVMAALVLLASEGGLELAGSTLGIVGVGRIGGRVAAAAAALGMKTLLNDPPRARNESDFRSRQLDELMHADFVTLHVPLIRHGPDRTVHLFNASRLSQLKNGAVLLNASRGGVVDAEALKRELDSGRVAAVLDVWPDEPEIDCTLLERVRIGTPHIGGQTLEAKYRGTDMIFQACCRHLGVEPAWTLPDWGTSPELQEDQAGRRLEDALHSLIRQAYDIEKDDRDLRRLLEIAPEKRVAAYHEIRRKYRRRELGTFPVTLTGQQRFREAARAVGFQVSIGIGEG